MLSKNKELWLSLLAAVIITAIYAFVVYWYRVVPAAASFFGHMIGVVGFLLMLMTETLYSFRKRSRKGRWGSMETWLQFHIFTGLVGPYMVLLHTSWKFSGLAGATTLLTIIIVISGFIGRYIYTRIPRSLEGIEITDPGAQAQAFVLARTRRRLSIWHAIHIPIGMALFVAAFIHIAAALTNLPCSDRGEMMEKKPYGCLTIPGLVTALLTVLVVVVVGLVRGGVLFSPGMLNAQSGAALGSVTSHAGLSDSCSACHAYFWQTATMADRCVLCHTDVAAQQKDPSTLHGDQLKKKPGMSCRACHPDHRGPNATLTDLSIADLSHDAFGYALTAHQRQIDGSPFVCKICHVNGYTTFDQTVCTACHQQIKAGFMQSHLQVYGQNCLACHDGIDTYGHNFNHGSVAFKLNGKHTSLDCGACHTGARSLADLKATPQDCFACHAKDDAHKGQFGSGCGTCHTTNGWLPATFDHSLTKFPLAGAHVGLACTKCHPNAAFTTLSTVCSSCHSDPSFHTGLFAGMTCDQCHTTTAWSPAIFNLSHPGGCGEGGCIDHRGATCRDCHTVNLSTATCLKCHDSNNPGDGGGGGGG